MLKSLMTFIVTFGALVSTTQARLPLIVDFIKDIKDVAPCVVPCLLANADQLFRQGTLVNPFQKCMLHVIDGLQTPPDLHSANFIMEVAQLLANTDIICPKLSLAIGCVTGFFQRTCGFGVGQMVEKYLTDVTKFLDCNVPDNEKLYLAECLQPPMANYGKRLAFQQCASHSLSFLPKHSWVDIYRDGRGNNFRTLCNVGSDLSTCYLDFVRPTTGTVRKCRGAVSEFRRQLHGIKEFANCYGNGTGFPACLGDPSLYMYNAISLFGCGQTFRQYTVYALEQVTSRFGPVQANNIKYILKEMAMKTCSAVPRLAACVKHTLWSRPACRQEVLPMTTKLIEPAMQYFNKLGRCQPLDSSALDSCRCIVDYKVRKEVIGSCSADPSFYVVSFVVKNKDYSEYTLRAIIADIRPKIDAIFRQKFGPRFKGSSQYNGRSSFDGLSMSLEVSFAASVTTTDYELLHFLQSKLDGGKLFGKSGTPYTVEYYKVSERVKKAKAPFPIMMLVLIVIVCVVVILLVACVVLCYCRVCYGKSQTQKNATVPVNFQQPEISYIYK